MKKLTLLLCMCVFLATNCPQRVQACNKCTVGVVIGAVAACFLLKANPEQIYAIMGRWFEPFAPQLQCLQGCMNDCMLGDD